MAHHRVGPCLLQRLLPRARTPLPATEAEPLTVHHRIRMPAHGRVWRVTATDWEVSVIIMQASLYFRYRLVTFP